MRGRRERQLPPCIASPPLANTAWTVYFQSIPRNRLGRRMAIGFAHVRPCLPGLLAPFTV